MYSRIQTIIDIGAKSFMQGDVSPILRFYNPVLPVYIAGNRLTLGSLEEVADSLETHYRAVSSMGFTFLSGKLIAQSIPRDGRFRAAVDWSYWHEAGFAGPVGRTTYYCRDEGDGPKIEMVEYPNLAFESACYWYADRLEPELKTGT